MPHVPDPFLEMMFGPGVEDAKDLYRSLGEDRRLLGALLLFEASNRIIMRFAIEGDEAVAWTIRKSPVSRSPSPCAYMINTTSASDPSMVVSGFK